MASAIATRGIRTRRRDPDSRLSVGLSLSHLLNTVEFQPPGFSAAATLIVRRLRDPMPRQLEANAWAIAATRPWERAAQDELAELSRGAARPARGFVPLNANAVLFADQGELLACLAVDLLRGIAPALWWWRAILRTLPVNAMDAVFAAWVREARYVPAMLAHLALAGNAVEVVSVFSPSQALIIFKEVARAFEIEHLCAGFERPFENSVPAPGERASGTSRSSRESIRAGTSLREFQESEPAPWRVLLPESQVPPTLSAEHSVLLAVSLLLQDSPRIVRARSFGGSLVQWRKSLLRANAERREHAPTKHSERAVAQPSTFGDGPRLTGEEQPSRERHREAIHFLAPTEFDQLIPSPAPPSAVKAGTVSFEASGSRGADLPHELSGRAIVSFPPGQISAGASASISESVTKEQSLETHCSIEARALQPSLNQQETVPSTISRLDSADDAAPTPSPCERFSTELGGVLFLVNLLKSLELPRSLEAAADVSLQLTACELLELIARALLYVDDGQLSADPVWQVLARLDRRTPGEMPGELFAPADIYRLPPFWFSNGRSEIVRELRVRVDGRGYVELWHAGGFPIVRRRLGNKSAHKALREEIAKFANAESNGGDSGQAVLQLSPFGRRRRSLATCCPLGIRPGSSLRQFLAFLLPYIRIRLARSLGIPNASSSEIVRTLLRQAGRIELTRSHVDVILDLSRANGIVRLSGLDANPGWLPAFGRVFTFHFRNGLV